jgi:hypothetical protein
MDLKGVLTEAAEDDLALWELATEARSELPNGTLEEVRNRVLDFVGPLLSGHLLVAGQLSADPPGKFVPWELTPDEALARVEGFMRNIHREPRLGDNFYFVATALGRRWAGFLA